MCFFLVLRSSRSRLNHFFFVQFFSFAKGEAEVASFAKGEAEVASFAKGEAEVASLCPKPYPAQVFRSTTPRHP